MEDNPTLNYLQSFEDTKKFKAEELPKEMLQEILKSVTQIHTAGGLEGFSVIVIREEETKKKLADYCGKLKAVVDAPVALLFCADASRLKTWTELRDVKFTLRGPHSFFWAFADALRAATTAATAALAQGLGVRWVDQVINRLSDIRELAEAPKFCVPVTMLLVGLMAEEAEPAPRFVQRAVVHYGKYLPYAEADLDQIYGKAERGFLRRVAADPKLKERRDEIGFTNYAEYISKDHYARKKVQEADKAVLDGLFESEFFLRTDFLGEGDVIDIEW